MAEAWFGMCISLPLGMSQNNPKHWKMGFFYYNPKNPLLIVPKLNGLGWTLNLGHKSLYKYLLFLLIVLAVYVAYRYRYF